MCGSMRVVTKGPTTPSAKHYHNVLANSACHDGHEVVIVPSVLLGAQGGVTEFVRPAAGCTNLTTSNLKSSTATMRSHAHDVRALREELHRASSWENSARRAADASDSSSELHRAKEQVQKPPGTCPYVVTSTTWTPPSCAMKPHSNAPPNRPIVVAMRLAWKRRIVPSRNGWWKRSSVARPFEHKTNVESNQKHDYQNVRRANQHLIPYSKQSVASEMHNAN